MTTKKAAAAGVAVKTVVTNDDIASVFITEKEKRRGVAGDILMWKIGGTAVEGYDIDGVIADTQKEIDNCRSIGIGLSSCIILVVGKLKFHIEDRMMEVDIGHHGETGIAVVPWQSAKKWLQQCWKNF